MIDKMNECSSNYYEVSTLDPNGPAEAQPNGILAVHVIVPSIQCLAEVNLLAIL